MACGSGGCGSGGCGSGGGCSTGGCATGCPALHVYDWLNDLGISAPPVVYDVVEVLFKGGRKGFYRNVRHLDVQTGDYVIVEADRGVDFGTVHLSGELVRLRIKSNDLLGQEDQFPNVVRVATSDDIKRWDANKEKETETFLIGRRAIDRMNLPMKLVDVEWQFDHKKVTFYFTAEHRVDFRALVRDLARRFRTRVELRQIGARDEAARIGGIGSCGRELCCSTWLQEFKPVSTQAAKTQNLPLNPVRLSGQCGRLKCCLNYELEQYMTALAAFPRIESVVETANGKGVVLKLDIFKERVWVRYPNNTWDVLALDEVKHLATHPPRQEAGSTQDDGTHKRGRRRGRKPRGTRSGPPRKGGGKQGPSAS